MYLICIIARWKLNLIHCYWIPFTFEFVTTLKYVLIKLRRYLFDCMYINGGFFHQWKLIINRRTIDESHSKRSHRLFIDFQYQSIDKYRLVLIDIDTHRLSISSIKYAGYYTCICHQKLPQFAKTAWKCAFELFVVSLLAISNIRVSTDYRLVTVNFNMVFPGLHSLVP
jgi:hypothetical protein